ncbi:MAG: VCBS repeat-containing protein, partial [Planctomycetales bacterium]|nr:VCBS repeat-containing protein [Planctomycetales bacterium]
MNLPEPNRRGGHRGRRSLYNGLVKRVRPINRRGRSLVIAFALLAAAMTIVAPGCSCSRDPQGNGTTSSPGGESEANLVRINAALASTENIEPEEAGKLWDDLHQQFPDDPSVTINRALNAVLQVDQLTSTATDGSRTSEEKKTARSKLPDAIESARAAIVDFQNLGGDTVTELWLRSRIDAHEAALLGPTIGKSLRRELFSRLIDAIDGPMGDSANAVILGGPLIDLLEKVSDPVDGIPDAFLAPATKTIGRLSDKNDGNLFLALRALRLAIEKHDDSAVRFVDRTWELAQSVEPTLAAYTKPIGITPKQLTDQIRDAVTNADWAKADQSSVLWSNVLNPLEILRTDRRRTSPHPLDRLNFDSVRRLSAEIAAAKPIARQDTALKFKEVRFGEDVKKFLAVDADLDLQVDVISVSSDGRLVLWQRQDELWKSTAELKLDQPPTGLIAADLFEVDSSHSDRIERVSKPSAAGADSQQKTVSDYTMKVRHDTLPGLIVFGDFGVQLIQIDTRDETDPDDRLTLVKGTTGLEGMPAVNAITTGDLDGDGDLDLIVALNDGQLRALVNRGNRTFFDAPIRTGTVDTDDPVADLAIADLDRDIDLDIVTIHRSGQVGMLENLLHLQFRFRYLNEVPKIPVESNESSLMIAVEDVDANVGWDIITTSSQQSQVAFGNSSDIGVWTVDRVETGDGFPSKPVIDDFDNDSYLELVCAGKTVKLGPWGINVMKPQSGIPIPKGDGDSGVIASADVDGDGTIDVIQLDGNAISVGLNQSGAGAHQLSVRFKGINDNAAASGRVNHYAIGSVLELRFGPYYRSRIVRGAATHFGMDGIDSADSIRVIMPNGLTQTIRAPKVDSVIEEEQTLKGSCPYLYSWDGDKFAFVTDCLWAAPLGLQVAAGKVQPDRPWEYLKIDGDFVRENEDGQYELRMTEELWEVAYVDKIELTAIDHPAEVDVFSNEKVGPPGIATPTVFSFAPNDLHGLDRALDTGGNDVTELLRRSDERYVKGFDRRIRQGLCEPHWIDLEFGDAVKKQLGATDDPSVLLVLRGWILPTDTSLNIQIDQNPDLPAIEFPSVWVPDASTESGWRNAIPFMGFPGGKTKT